MKYQSTPVSQEWLKNNSEQIRQLMAELEECQGVLTSTEDELVDLAGVYEENKRLHEIVAIVRRALEDVWNVCSHEHWPQIGQAIDMLNAGDTIRTSSDACPACGGSGELTEDYDAFGRGWAMDCPKCGDDGEVGV